MRYYKKLKIIIILVICQILLFFSSCTDKDVKLPYAFINYSFYLSDPAFSDLNSVSGTAFLKNEGINGVLIYRKSYEEIVAYDGNCTYIPENRCAAQIIENEQSAQDSCCSSVFRLEDGYPISGPASLPLYEYRVLMDNDRVVIVNK